MTQWDGTWENVKMLRTDTPKEMAIHPEETHGNDEHLKRVLILSDDGHLNSVICEHQREINDIKRAILDATSLTDLKDRVSQL